MLRHATDPVGYTGNPAVDALLRGWRWEGDDFAYAFATTTPDGPKMQHPFAGVLDTGEKAMTREAFDIWEEFIPVRFHESSDPSSSLIRIALGTGMNPLRGDAFYPDKPQDQVLWLNKDYYRRPEAEDGHGSHELRTIIHEIGHILGLSHPHDRPGAPMDTDWALYSIMSYRDRPFDQVDHVRGANLYQATPMRSDILAAQKLYGVSREAEGDTVWKLEATQAPRAIFDYAGNDTIDAAARSSRIHVDLAQWGSHATLQELGDRLEVDEDGSHFEREATVWLMSRMENVIGSDHGDWIRGNDVGNRLQGGRGDDRLFGGAGDDLLIGGRGDDVLTGGSGRDVFRVVAGDDDRITDYQAGFDRIEWVG